MQFLAVYLLSGLCLVKLLFARHLPDPTLDTDTSPEEAVDHHVANQNAPCQPLIIGHGPRPDPDTPAEFQNFTTLFAAARIASTPLGYKLVGQALNGSVYGKVLRGYNYLEEYNPAVCAQQCNDIRDCSAFNIYFERDPVVDPSYDGGCPNPPSTTTIKCVLWGQSINTEVSLNRGEKRCDFKVLIAGSNYYLKQSALQTLSDYGFFGPRGEYVLHNSRSSSQEPVYSLNMLFRGTPVAAFADDRPNSEKAGSTFPHTAMLEPTDGYLTFLGLYRQIYNPNGTGPSYDPAVCAEQCNALTEYNSINKVNEPPYINGAYPKCNMFNMFETSLISDNNPLYFLCFFYSTSWDSVYATETSGVDPEGRHLHAALVRVYQRLDYTDPPLCALKECEGAQYYRGGNCSGWGPDYCTHKSGRLLE